MKSKIIKDIISTKVTETLKNPQELQAIPAKMKDLVSAGMNGIMTMPQRPKRTKEERFKAILKIMYLLHTSKGNISAEQTRILNEIALKFGNRSQIELSELDETTRKLQEIRNNSSIENFGKAFAEEVKEDCDTIQRGLLFGITTLEMVRRAYVIWIAAALSTDPDNYPELRVVLEKLTYNFKETRSDKSVRTLLLGREEDNGLVKMFKSAFPLTRPIDAIITAIQYDSEKSICYIQNDFIQSVENDCKLILKLNELVETEKNPELKAKIEESIKQITAYLFDHISPYDTDCEFELEDEE